MDNVEKLLWLYMIEHSIINGRWEHYYGDFTDHRVSNKELIDLVREKGIDWKKTKPVSEDSQSSFTSTFTDPDFVSTLQGTLYLKGEKEGYTCGTRANALDILKAMSMHISLKDSALTGGN